MKAKEVKEMTSEELAQKLAELKSELFNLRFRLASGQLENPVSIRTCKRDIARVNTEIRARELKASHRRTAIMERNLRKERVGLVVSDKMDKTVVVLVSDKSKHPLYKKTITKTKRIKAHDENNECGIGDKVRIVETRKLSKDKNWRVAEIVEKAK